MQNNAIVVAAVLAATCFAAAAQSGVVIYGLVDANVGSSKGLATGTNALDKATYRVDGGGLSVSRIGFRGNEELGGGLNASFDLSSFITLDNGAAGRSPAIGPPVNVAADPFWSRAAWVGLGSRALGRIRIGNIASLMWFGKLTNNSLGDSVVFSPINLVTFVGGPLTGGTTWTDSVVYDSPEFAGFSFSGQGSASEQHGGRNVSARAGYGGGPVSASVVWQDVKKNPTTFADGTSPNNTRSWSAVGSYDFGGAKLYAHLGQIVNHGTEAAPLNVKYDIWGLDGNLRFGGGDVIAAFAVRQTSNAVAASPATAAGGNKSRRVFTIGYDYPLSKRTDLYAMALLDRTQTNTAGPSARVLGATGNAVSAGVRARF